MSDSLKHKTVRGAGWSLVENMLSHGMGFLIGLILARLLSPKEYGLIGIITIFTVLFDTIVDSGFTNALIRKKDADDKDYNTVFVANIVLSSLLSALLFVCSPYISLFFKLPELTSLMKVMSCVIIINAFAIVQRALLTKRMDFKTLTKISVTSNLTSGAVGICMAFFGFGVWSLVAQQITSRLMQSLLLTVFGRWRPRLSFYKERFSGLFSFAWKLLVSSIINNIWKQIYSIVVGKCYTVETLGLYSRANHMSQLFSVNLTNVVQRVSFPALSSIQDEEERMKSIYRKVIKITMLVCFICMLGLSATSKSLIEVLIGAKWLPCVPFLQIICFQKMLYPLHAINLNMLQVKGRSDLYLIIEIVKKILGVIPVLFGIFVGIYWMLISSVVIGIIDYFVNAFYSGKLIDYSIMNQIKDIVPSFFVSLFMFGVLFSMSFINISPYVLLPLQVLTGGLLVIFICEYFHLEEYYEVKKLAFSMVKKIRK